MSISPRNGIEPQRTAARSAANAIAELESATRSCNRCHQPFELDETYVVLEGTSWHQDCFRCAQCLLELSLGEDFFEVDGRFYCKHDFEVLYAPICTKCNSFIVGKVMKSANFSFHPACFNCADCEGLLDDGVWCVNGRLVCYNCKEMSPKVPHYVCMKCRQLIVPEDMLRINNDFFHAYHFHCSACRSPLTSEARQLEKQWYCQRCFDLRCETCAGCHKAIDKLREKSAVALGKAFHAEHFRCVKCDVAFMGRQHYEHSGKAYCEEDFIKLCGEFCNRCDRLLTGATVSLMGRKWCVECYRCLACDRILRHRGSLPKAAFTLPLLLLRNRCRDDEAYRRDAEEQQQQRGGLSHCCCRNPASATPATLRNVCAGSATRNDRHHFLLLMLVNGGISQVLSHYLISRVAAAASIELHPFFVARCCNSSNGSVKAA